MRISSLKFPEVLLLEPTAFHDSRGYFFESFRLDLLQQHLGYAVSFVQESQSFSRQHVVRGLHYQLHSPQAKLVKVLTGHIFDVVVDVRRHSASFGQHCAVELDAAKHQQLFIPAGFAHGFQVMSEQSSVLYKTTSYYQPGAERAIRWNDTDLAIEWPMTKDVILSERDAQACAFADADYL